MFDWLGWRSGVPDHEHTWVLRRITVERSGGGANDYSECECGAEKQEVRPGGRNGAIAETIFWRNGHCYAPTFFRWVAARLRGHHCARSHLERLSHTTSRYGARLRCRCRHCHRIRYIFNAWKH